MALPQILKLRLPGLDSNIQAIGPGRIYYEGSQKAGARTRSMSIYDIFYPQGRYVLDVQISPDVRCRGAKQVENLANDRDWIVPGTYDPRPTTPIPPSEELTIELLPGQLASFARLYKLARVERVDFNFKFTNMGVSSVTKSGDPPSLSTQNLASSSISHLLAVLPKSQWDRILNLGFSGSWSPDSEHSNSNAAQLAELPGSTFVSTSQDGNREIVHVKKSYDCAARMGGDPIRQTTWLKSKDDGTAWEIPPSQDTDPRLGVIGTSPLIDQFMGSSLGNMNINNGDWWFRYNEHVHVFYHITFWEPKTPTLTFN